MTTATETETPSPSDPGGDRKRLDRSLVRGVAWTSGIKWGSQVLTWAATILVMRLLTPADYGLVGMAGLFLGLVTLVSEFGIGSAVIALRDLTSRQIAQLNSVALLVGSVACALCIAAAQPIAEFFDSAELPLVIVTLSTTFVISALSVVPAGIMRRDLRYKTLAMVEAAQAIGDVVATLALAWLGYGYWALVAGRIAKFVVGAVALWFLSPPHFAVPRPSEIRKALTFSYHVIAGRMGWYAYSNGDYLIVGKMLGQGALGLYNAAFTLSRMPAEKITGTVARVSPGIFSAVQNDLPALRRYILILTEGLALTAWPPIIGLGLVAPELVPLLLGPEWTGAIVPLQILSIGAGLSAVTPILPQVLQVVGETGFTMRRSIVAMFVFLPSFLVGGWYFGIAGVALAWVLLEPAVVSMPLLLRIRDRTGLTVREYADALWPAFSACVAMAGAVVLVRSTLPELEPVVKLLLEVTTGAIAYGAALLLLHRARLDRLMRAAKLLRR